MAVPPTISLTQTQIFTAIGDFLAGVVLTGTEVIQAQVNRVPEPRGGNFCLMTPLRQDRLETNETAYFDNILTGSIAGTTLTVASIQRAASPLAAGMTLIDSGFPTMRLQPNTVIVAQLTGSPGGVGTYTVSPTQTVAQETMYAGFRADLAAARYTVQLDIHGPASGNNVRIIDTLFRSEVGTQAFADAGVAVAPLYCNDARQMPFVNDQQQYEDRWVMEACFQINAIVGTPQQFADTVTVDVIEAATQYTGP